MKKSIGLDKITLGTCYYPEQWREELWEDDIVRMKKAGIEVIRIAEFAWNKTEPREGEFDFAFLDSFISLTEKLSMRVIMGTPTATPPAWLTKKYPEALNADMTGVLFRHGSRRHYNYNSPKYRELCARIVTKLAERYAGKEIVVGWQIDNEINCEADVFYSDADAAAWREFLRRKYVSLDSLNEAWGTVFWNQTYSDWDEIDLPRRTVNGAQNPHEMLDYIRFISESAIGFAKMQADIIRQYLRPGAFITTNGMFSHLDNHKMTDEALDFYMYDSYPNFAFGTGGHPERGMADRGWSRDLSVVRSVSPNFGVMEQQSGAGSWNIWGLSPQPKPGQMKLWCAESIAHGADYVSFFRWRTATMGTEIYWHGILDYYNRDNRRLSELCGISEWASCISPVAGGRYRAEVGVIRDYDNVFDCDVDAWHRTVEGESSDGIFCAAQHTHTPFDYVYINDKTTAEELSRYRVLFYPHAAILTVRTAKLLHRYVSCGGVLVLGCRTGYKDETGKCLMMPPSGYAGPLAGVDVRESTAVAGGDAVPDIVWGSERIPAGIYNDIITPLDGTEVIARYDGAYYNGKPALARRRCGGGYVYYFGGTFREPAARLFLSRLGVMAPFGGTVTLPESCELAVRENAGGSYMFILNYKNEKAVVSFAHSVTDMTTGDSIVGDTILPPYGVGIYKL